MFSKSFFQAVAATLTMASAASALINNTVYIITNAETPALNVPGLSFIGFDRATNCIPPIFAPLDVGFIITCPFDKGSGLCSETETTAAPVAAALGLTPDISCGAGGSTADDCLIDLMRNFAKNSTQSILVIWDMTGLNDFFDAINVDQDFKGEEDSDDSTPHYDLITTVIRGEIRALASMECPGIDGQAPGTFRKRSLSSPSKKTASIRKMNARVTRLLKSGVNTLS